jgi:hypothetical protein
VIEFPKKNVWIPPLQLVNPFDQVIHFKEGHDLATYNSNGWSILKFDNFVVADFNGMNTGRCIKQAPYTMLMIQVRFHVFILTYKIHFMLVGEMKV